MANCLATANFHPLSFSLYPFLKMGKRRSGRELAFRLLFQIDVGGATATEVFTVGRTVLEASPEVWNFATKLARGAWEGREPTDAIIEKYATGWSLQRMANVDRNLLRMALYEILESEDIPNSVAVNEAVELAKTYSTVDSARFINGVLGAYLRDEKQRKEEEN